MAKQKQWRGMNEVQLAAISLDEFTALLKSRARRTLKRISKNPGFKHLVEKASKIKAKNPVTQIKTRTREAIILPSWLGLNFGVYNGKEYKQVSVTIDKVGRRLGEFVHTTRNVIHSGPGVGATRSSKFIPLK
ncbi:30S ribosomal protein S19 [Candidatus Micrarchaeota archaeon CG08_land_8_20_14_0_20_49_17]|nr:MAG: hypothetical protein AUJ13_02125 [Candidatus Micrarchaeota archaeon CG1_02_49_24]PIU09731.1 MAG: 30S ribosomal protein S19 [Candidatus Micrarchaeota archaeon CG08_land_8_20_14_0_20_49_17]PIU81252.1 MAG: 30S ribosomal protein S19 [Candidatus Micrarchaeota archaeon CG06_land_8_20_14_3_00_50_6]PIZ94276.1 MAG: 30S ribosomal protein S19 [Candidatus Micrarchaeota archaeon CG_4_10_14_0_2_um_filter_49_7]